VDERPLLVVREIEDHDEPYWLAATDDGRAPLLEVGEALLWQGFAQVRQKLPSTWELEGMGIVVTDRRLIFLTTEFDKGGGYSGWGGLALVAATGLNAISKHQARKRSRGKVAIGHVRHEWARELSTRRRKVLIGGPDVAVVLSVLTGGSPKVLELKGPATREDFGRWLAGLISRHRLATDGTLDERARELLMRQVDGSGAPAPQYGEGSAAWGFPGGLVGRSEGAPGERPGPAPCPRCGERTAPNQRFCTGCGLQLTATGDATGHR
jgi:hypothetical protein